MTFNLRIAMIRKSVNGLDIPSAHVRGGGKMNAKCVACSFKAFPLMALRDGTYPPAPFLRGKGRKSL